MAHERDPALGGDAARLRLGDVVKQRAEAHRLRTVELVRQRFGEQRPDPVSLLGKPALGCRRHGDRLGQHGPRVVVDVEVVVRALLDPAQPSQLR